MIKLLLIELRKHSRNAHEIVNHVCRCKFESEEEGLRVSWFLAPTDVVVQAFQISELSASTDCCLFPKTNIPPVVFLLIKQMIGRLYTDDLSSMFKSLL